MEKLIVGTVRQRGLLMLTAAMLVVGLFPGVSLADADQPAGPSAPRIHLKDGTSTNWSGYAVETNLNNPQDNAVSDVGGAWTILAVACTALNAYSATWVGIDGYDDKTVEQIGTDADCYRGHARYYAWYEMYPKMSKSINMTIHAGDVMNAEVQYTGSGNYVLTLINTTTNKSFQTTQKAQKALRQSAEWIVEAPSSGGVLPLANFGNEPFSNAQATLNGHSGTISDGAWQYDAITMVNSGGQPKAIPSALSLDGSSFSVAWQSY